MSIGSAFCFIMRRFRRYLTAKQLNTQKHNYMFFYIVNIACPLFIGLFLYLTLRENAYVSAFFIRRFSLPAFPHTWLRLSSERFIGNHASDILWAYSLTFAVMLTLKYSKKNLLLTFFICVGFAVLTEFFQKYQLFPGTFDVLDMLFEALSVCLALIIIKIYEVKK